MRQSLKRKRSDEQTETPIHLDVFQFFNRSADKPPGKGLGEVVHDAKMYKELAELKHWRRVFSDMYEGEPLKIDGVTYKTHHHAFQAAKFRVGGHPKTSHLFSMDSKSEIGLGSAAEAYRKRKVVMLSPSELKAWNQACGLEKDKIYAAKFASDRYETKVLLATGNALLVSRPPRMKRIECVRLMNMRTALRLSGT